MPGFPVHHQLPELAQTNVCQVSDALQPSHPLSSPSPAFNLSQHLGLFQWVSWNVYVGVCVYIYIYVYFFLILHQIAHKTFRSYCKAKTEVKIKINLTEKVPSAQQAFPNPRKINLSFRPWTRLKMISEWQCPWAVDRSRPNPFWTRYFHSNPQNHFSNTITNMPSKITRYAGTMEEN